MSYVSKGLKTLFSGRFRASQRPRVSTSWPQGVKSQKY